MSEPRVRLPAPLQIVVGALLFFSGYGMYPIVLVVAAVVEGAAVYALVGGVWLAFVAILNVLFSDLWNGGRW